MAACERCSASFDPGARFCGSCGAPAEPGDVPDDGDPWIGRVVDRRYRVVMRLGSGGMGVVYQVEHLHLGKKAAMKVLTPDGAAQPEMVRRFRNEAQAVSKLDHPNIVQTFDFGQCDGALYLVMEYINGEDLSALIRREGPWSFARSARLFVQVCAGLVEAHDAGIVHRDLKPENLMVVKRRDGSEHVKILDFGLAKLRERATDSERSSVSSGGQVIGTPYYMAPEQVRGEPLDARADLYSVGATLYRVLTGLPPFDAPSPMSVLAKHLTDDLIPPCARAPERALPPEADRIVLRAMEKVASERYASALEMRDDLERALSEIGAGARTSFSSSSPSAPPSPAELDPVPVSRADALTVPIDDSDIVGYGDRLRRSDVDDYEWGMRRRRLDDPPHASAGRAGGDRRRGGAVGPLRRRARRARRARAQQHPGLRQPASDGRPAARNDREIERRRSRRRRLLPRPGRQGLSVRSTRGWRGSPTSIWCWRSTTPRGAASPRATSTVGAGASGCSRPPSDLERLTWPCARSGSRGRSRPRRWPIPTR